MKEIDLPSVPQFIMTMSPETISPEPNIDEDGRPWFTIGTMDFSETNKLLTIVKSNGSKILYATTWLESLMEELLMYFFMGGDGFASEKNFIFKNDVLGASGFSFSLKKETCTKIVNKFELLKGKNKTKFQKSLKDIMDWRNAFAHGTLGYDGGQKKCYVNYYQGEQKRLYLDDDFWSKCEDTFKQANELVLTLNKKLRDEISKNSSEQPST